MTDHSGSRYPGTDWPRPTTVTVIGATRVGDQKGVWRNGTIDGKWGPGTRVGRKNETFNRCRLCGEGSEVGEGLHGKEETRLVVGPRGVVVGGGERGRVPEGETRREGTPGSSGRTDLSRHRRS